MLSFGHLHYALKQHFLLLYFLTTILEVEKRNLLQKEFKLSKEKKQDKNI